MNAKNEEGKKRDDSFFDSKELFNKIFKEAIQEIKLEKRGKKQSLPVIQAPPPERSQNQKKTRTKEKSAALPAEPGQRKPETTQGGAESELKRAESTLPPRSTPKLDNEKGGRRSVAGIPTVLLILLVILAGAVSGYMGIIDISFLAKYFGSGREQATQPPVPKKQPVTPAEKALPSLNRPQELSEPPSSVPSGPSPSGPSKDDKLAELETPTTIAQAQADKARVEENEPRMSTINQPEPPSIAAKEEPQPVLAQTQPSAKPAAPEVGYQRPPSAQYPYSVYLGSFKSFKAVNKALIEYQEKGISVYWSRVDLGDKGVWYRFFTGHFRTKEEAENFIKERNIEGATPGITKYAALIGSYESDKEVEEWKQALVSAGFYPYTVKGSDGKSLIYSGAFDRKEYAEKEKNALSSKGILSEVVER